jgi:quercetin dioxygenase-like cupin family protein
MFTSHSSGTPISGFSNPRIRDSLIYTARHRVYRGYMYPKSIKRRNDMRGISKVSRAIVGLVLLVFFLMYVGSLPLTAQNLGKTPQNVLFEKVVELPSKTVNVKIRRVTLPVGFKTPEHTHKGPGPRYLLKGKVEVIEGGVTGIYQAGEIFWETGAPMTTENVGGEEAEAIIIELLPVK